jgi:hypothetical protein
MLKNLHCPHCKRVLCQTDGATLIYTQAGVHDDGSLYVSARSSFRRPVTFWCDCGTPTPWSPRAPYVDPDPVPTLARVCYTEAEEA